VTVNGTWLYALHVYPQYYPYCTWLYALHVYPQYYPYCTWLYAPSCA
jgi:hypothetical protein